MGWNVLKISVRSIWSNVFFKTCVSLLIFSVGDLSISVSGVLKSPNIILLLWISFFRDESLENPMDRGALWAAVHGVVKSRTWLVTSLWLFTFMHWRRKWQPIPVFLPRESQGWESLVGCCLWGHTESSTTEVTWQLSSSSLISLIYNVEFLKSICPYITLYKKKINSNVRACALQQEKPPQ